MTDTNPNLRGKFKCFCIFQVSPFKYVKQAFDKFYAILFLVNGKTIYLVVITLTEKKIKIFKLQNFCYFFKYYF